MTPSSRSGFAGSCAAFDFSIGPSWADDAGDDTGVGSEAEGTAWAVAAATATVGGGGTLSLVPPVDGRRLAVCDGETGVVDVVAAAADAQSR